MLTFHVRFNRSRSWAPWPTRMRNAHIRTGAARGNMRMRSPSYYIHMHNDGPNGVRFS